MPSGSRYAHELLDTPPYDGFVVHRSLVDALPDTRGQVWSTHERDRLHDQGVQQFFRVKSYNGRRLKIIGDCGSFGYANSNEPVYTAEQAAEFYEACGFDVGLSPDHNIRDHNDDADDDSVEDVNQESVRRQALSLSLADDFLRLHTKRRYRFVPVGVAQGWSPVSYACAARSLVRMGYDRIALGGVSGLKPYQTVKVLEAVASVVDSTTRIHLVGLQNKAGIHSFGGLGVSSFDSSWAFRQSQQPPKKHYLSAERNYTAISVPSVDKHPTIRSLIRTGQANENTLRELEQDCFSCLRALHARKAKPDDVLACVQRYHQAYGAGAQFKELRSAYRRTLLDRAWRRCGCVVCQTAGVDVVVLRQGEHNRRRGFHNLGFFYQQVASCP